jgi:predicted dehydrogenase
MFEREKPTIVSICTWPESHAEITLSAVKSGARAIFCEKPLADTIENGRQLVETCDSHNVCLIVNHSRRWDVEHQQIRDFLCKGQLGTLQHATVHYARGISNTGSHLVDLLRCFFGEVDWVRAFDRLKEKDAEPSLDGYIMMKNGIGCSIAGCPRGHYDIFDWDIIGTGGRLRIEDMGRKTRLWRPAPNPGWPGRQMLIEAASPFVPGLTGMMAGAVNNVVGCLTKHEKPLDTGQDGLAALETITALKQSAVSEGKRVNLPLGQ